MAERIQLPAYTDAWMMGDRYGEVVKVTTMRTDKGDQQIAHVKCDKSQKVRKVIYDDCVPV